MKNLSLYIHIPFCKSRCTYCGFLTFANKSGWIPSYIRALQKEIRLKAKKFTGYKIESVYFGGGTPSLIESELVEQIICTIREDFTVKKSAEITIESNPESVTAEKIQTYKKAGINRFSMGAQSLSDKTLKRVARPHNSKQIFKALESFKKEKIKNFGLDFIMGLPFQTFASFKKELETILKYNPPHLSYYFLSHDTEQIKNFLPECPDEETQIKMYKHLTKILKKAGYIHYEVSNYAKPGFECRHNLRYWNQQEYLGLGLGAHSYIDDTVLQNETDLDKYIKNPDRIIDKYKHDEETHRLDYIMLNLRKHTGINLKDFEKRFKKDFTQKLLSNAAKIDRKLLIRDKTIRLTEKGFLFADNITEGLLV
jgi:oxygen-independent coproporphyrinogen III oxidase